MAVVACILIQNYEIWDSFCRVFVVAGAGERILHRHANAEFKKMYVLYEVNNANARGTSLALQQTSYLQVEPWPFRKE